MGYVQRREQKGRDGDSLGRNSEGSGFVENGVFRLEIRPATLKPV